MFCTPLTLVERHRTNPTEGCGPGAQCTTDLADTTGPLVSSEIQLTFTFLSGNQNLTWYKNTVPVANCPGATHLPAGLGACVNSRSSAGNDRADDGPSDPDPVTLGVLWRGGPDPTWAG